MRAALVRGAAVLAAILLATAGCGSSEPEDPAPPASGAAQPSASAPAESASPSGAEAVAEFCAHLNAFSAAAGPTLELGAIALIDGESANERETVSQLVQSIALHGVLLKSDLPADLGDDADTVVGAATEAKRTLEAGSSAADALDLLQAPKVKAARDALVKYRGSC